MHETNFRAASWLEPSLIRNQNPKNETLELLPEESIQKEVERSFDSRDRQLGFDGAHIAASLLECSTKDQNP